MNRAVKLLGLLVILGVTMWVAYFFYQHHRFVITDNAFQMADIVNVSTQDVSGKLVKLYKKEFQEVRKGEPLFKIDDRIYRAQVKALEHAVRGMIDKEKKLKVQLERLKEELPANYSEALKAYRASTREIEALREEIKTARVNYTTAVESARAEVEASRSALKAAQESYETVKRKFERFKNLYLRRVISKQQYEEMRATYFGALAKLEAARAKSRAAEENLKRAESLKFKVSALEKKLEALKEKSLALKEQVRSAEAQLKRIEELKKAIEELKEGIKSKEAQLERARELLANTLVRSPVNGVVAKRWKEPGEFVSPGLPVYSLYDPGSFYVLGWIDEDKVRFIKSGSKALAELEACKKEFKGRVVSVGTSAGSVFALIPRDTSQGEYTRVTQRVPVKVRLKGVPPECIKPGTNVTLYIKKE